MISISKSKIISENKVANSVLEIIGTTPLVHLSRISKQTDLLVYGKLESSNPGGSIKDRTAHSIIQKGFANGSINANTTLVESSSGNMAIGLAQACKYYKLPLIIVVDPKANTHTLKILNAYGVQIEKVTKPLENGGFLAARLERVQDIIRENPNAFWTNQYGNEANPKAHHQTMREIANTEVGTFDYVILSTSTCGTLMGCAEYIKTHNLPTKIIAVDAEGSVIFGQNSEKRLIPGHGAGLPSQFLNKNVVDEVVHISDWDCVQGCDTLLEEESILAGGSSGGIITALLKIASNLPKKSKIAVILCDRGERYMDTIFNPLWREEHFGKKNV